MAERTIIPTAIIHPKSIVIYSRSEGGYPKRREKIFVKFDDNGQPVYSSFLKSSRKAEGKVSLQAKRKLAKAVEYLVATAVNKKVHEKLTGKIIQFKVAFITLTLPAKQQHTDKEIINTCLNQFIVEIKKYHNVSNYVWRAEKQGNGNIHFHMLIDRFIPWWELRNRWNRIVNKLGYVDKFQEKHGHETPNSTDIHSTKKIENIHAYLTKYLTKDENTQRTNEMESQIQVHTENEPDDNYNQQTGRIWGCNQKLSEARGCSVDIDWETSNELQAIVKNSKARLYETDYFKVIYIDFRDLSRFGAPQLFKYFSNYLIEHFNFNQQLSII